ncbi:MAG TPA: DUF2179 domain-containing protein [Bacillota bacterium]|nr:DUF2179 domain-containing protein [Candidatus Fermentithermobacillaceae bacterium]HOA71097.1 DUF2179 domain-containing protein [Bacillota bacterium]HPT36029.1 DUF2179 domain-containing protein [Bacillota bacterium]HPZ85561.1 DUF2179 domain-containing protein [Bacillota bacterium]HQD86013.1 DUF2179 domain-containing protein [Bacillota bacterium]
MLLEYLLIFFARVCDVTLSTVRMILVVRGKRYPAAAIGLVEASIYITALGRVMRNIDDPLKVLAYGLGFASGTLLGSWVEERLALGHVTLEVIPPEENAEELLRAVRTAGYGVTVLTGHGLKGPKQVLLVSTDRKSLPRLAAIIEEFAPDSFMTVLETRAVRGGVTPFLK